MARLLSKSEKHTIMELYANNSTKIIANKLNCSVTRVYNYAHSLGIKKSTTYLASEASGSQNVMGSNSIAHRFAKGSVPANKGKKQTDFMSANAIAASAKTRFKKGQTPHNTYSKDMVTIRYNKCKIPYKFIRQGKGNWLPLHVFLYSQANGAIAPGNIIVFKDKNTLNCILQNLECITRAENMLRNSHVNFNPEIREVLQIKRLLTRKINKIEQNLNKI